MVKLNRWISEFAKRDDGPTAVEYAVMLGMILMAVFGAVTSFGTTTNNSFTRSGNATRTTGS